MTEEQITKEILNHLSDNGWNILAYDFPQSGTGKVFYSSTDNKAIVPDIIAVKDNVCLIFENKNRFYEPDFDKLAKLKATREYENGILAFVGRQDVIIKTAVGMPEIENVTSCMDEIFKRVDYVYFVNNDNVKIIITKRGVNKT